MLEARSALKATWILIVLAVVGCTRLTAQDQEHYASRLYPVPYERVLDAVIMRVTQYPMGLADADLVKGVVRSHIGKTTPNLDATVDYQVTVIMRKEGDRTRVIPNWHVNISSEPTQPDLRLTSIEKHPLLYKEFFDELDTLLARSTAK